MAAILLCAFVSGCTTGVMKRPASFKVHADPPGTTLWLDDGKSRRILGPSPQVVEHEYEVEATDFNELNWLWTLAPLAVAAIGFGVGGTAGNDEGEFWGGIISGCVGSGLLIATVVGLGIADGLESEKVIEKPWRVGAEKDGFVSQEVEVALGEYIPDQVLRLPPAWYTRYGMASEKELDSPGSVPQLVRALADSDPATRAAAVRAIGRLETRAAEARPALEALAQDPDPGVKAAVEEALRKLRFAALADGGAGPAGAGLAPAGKTGLAVLAVFEVQDPSKRFKADVLQQLTEYLAVRLTEAGKFRVVPQDQLRQRLYEAKSGTYRACVDESCQIELGKELAATKTLTSKLLQVGQTCVITATLYDLKSATAERATSFRTGCDEGALIDGIDKTVQQLTAQ
jgi:hypothetical protein